MATFIPEFLRLLSLLSILTIFGCSQGNSVPANHLPDLTDPASSDSYGVEELSPEGYASYWDHSYRLRISPLGTYYLVNSEKLDDRQLTDLVIEYVLNPKRMPHYAESPKHAFIRLIDYQEKEISWRACAIEAIRSAYLRIWNDAAKSDYGKEYALLTRHEKECILISFPVSIDVAGPWINPPPPPPPPLPQTGKWEG